MTWVNSPTRFGLVSRLIHWAMAALILGMLLLGTRLGAMQPGLENLWLYGLHKTGGLVALSLVVLRVIWHRISPPLPRWVRAMLVLHVLGALRRAWSRDGTMTRMLRG